MIGHNSKSGNVSADQLRSIIERIERLTEEKDAIASDIRDVLAEAKSGGFCTKAIKQILKLRQKEAHERDEEQLVLETYMRSLGMLPLFEEVP